MKCVKSERGSMLKKVMLSVAVCCFVGVSQTHAQKLKKESMIIGAHGTNAKEGNCVDLTNGKIYDMNFATLHQGDIDIVYGYGSKTGVNIMTPSSSSIRHFGKNMREKIYEGWDTKNKGILIAVSSKEKDVKKAFRKAKNREALEEVYKKAAGAVTLRDDYERLRHGPGVRLTRMEIGDLIVFRSVEKDLYAVGQIVNHAKGYSGTITVDWKISAK
ncbi:hypothetical protein [Sinomicrobium sp.]